MSGRLRGLRKVVPCVSLCGYVPASHGIACAYLLVRNFDRLGPIAPTRPLPAAAAAYAYAYADAYADADADASAWVYAYAHAYAHAYLIVIDHTCPN